jgi:hypothetical protein
MMSFKPGQSPPHVTIPAVVFAGSKKRRSRGPATSKLTPVPVLAPESEWSYRTLSASVRKTALGVLPCFRGEVNEQVPRERIDVSMRWFLSLSLIQGALGKPEPKTSVKRSNVPRKAILPIPTTMQPKLRTLLNPY